MTVITHKRKKSKLAEMIDKPGGISIGVAPTQARANIETLRAPSLSLIAEEIRELLAIAPPSSPEETFDRLIEVYKAANSVIDAAGPFEMTELCAASAQLCNLVDAARPGAPFDWRIVTVHGQAMQMLLKLHDDATEARQTVLASLQKVQDKTVPSQPD